MTDVPVGAPRAAVVNLGCRVNRVESDTISRQLAAEGFELVDDEREADVVVINTCAVTGEAEAKTRKAVRHAAALPGLPLVIATGCAVNLHGEAIEALSGRVRAVPGKAGVARAARTGLGLAAPSETGEAGPHGLSGLAGRTRLGVKIQDGCNHRCTYCIVWKARGPETSVPVEAVVAELARIADAGIPEVALTGVNLGAYRGLASDGGEIGLPGLIEEVLGRTGIPQLRLSSVEPMDIDPALVSCMASHQDRVAPFLHLPLQSGCTATLRRMGRPYSAAAFARTVDRVRTALPSASVSCDVIAGFPGETDDEFEQSYAFCERMGFSRMHVFRYSARPGTPAARAKGQVDPHVMAERASRLRALARASALSDAAARVGTVERAVIESGTAGTTSSLHRIVVEGAPHARAGTLVRVAIMGVDGDGTLHGRVQI